MPEAPAATSDLSTTSAPSPAAARCQPVESPWTPAPITRWRAEEGSAGISSSSVLRGLPALQHRRPPVLPDGLRITHPGPELGLGELRVRGLQPDAVRVSRREVRHQHLARDLVLAPVRDREVDPQEGVRVAVEDGGRALLLEQLDILEPVQVLPRGRRVEVDVLHQRDVLLIGKALAGEILRIDRDDLLRLADLVGARHWPSSPAPPRAASGM